MGKINKMTNTEIKSKNTFNAEDDGKTHINIWINSKTPLGVMLAHFYESPFVHPFFGPFASMEGFWHYVQNEEQDDSLRSLSGMSAKKRGKRLTWRHVENFHEIITAANFYKIEQNAELKKLFLESTLPFDYYYIFAPKGDAVGLASTVIRPPGYDWLVKGFEDIRKMMQHGDRPSPNLYAQFAKVNVDQQIEENKLPTSNKE